MKQSIGAVRSRNVVCEAHSLTRSSEAERTEQSKETICDFISPLYSKKTLDYPWEHKRFSNSEEFSKKYIDQLNYYFHSLFLMVAHYKPRVAGHLL